MIAHPSSVHHLHHPEVVTGRRGDVVERVLLTLTSPLPGQCQVPLRGYGGALRPAAERGESLQGGLGAVPRSSGTCRRERDASQTAAERARERERERESVCVCVRERERE